MNSPGHTEDTESGSARAFQSQFAATRWTLVLRARGDTPEARAALSELCNSYYNPVVAFLRRERRSEDEARELAHDFFARVLSGSGFEGAEPSRGRFRSYVLGALKHYLVDARLRSSRQKRGGGQTHESMNAHEGVDTEEHEKQFADPAAIPPDRLFDREWALEVMRRALDRVEAELRGKGKERQFEILKPWLGGEADISQFEAAQSLSMTEGAVKVTIHRLRKRFGELVRVEIAETLNDPALVEQELADLIAAL